jgi:type IV secretion system protein VirD4
MVTPWPGSDRPDAAPSQVFTGLAVGLPELVWDPVAGCVDSMVAERRAKAFTAGTVKGAVAGGYGDDAARFMPLRRRR